MPTPKDNPYFALRTPAELYAFLVKQHGEQFLHRAFDFMAESPLLTSPESIEDSARELEKVGLPKVAAIVREYAAKFLPEDDLSRCPYQEKPYTDFPKELAQHQSDWKDDVRRHRRLGNQWWDRTIKLSIGLIDSPGHRRATRR
jgi:hypothetical protein